MFVHKSVNNFMNVIIQLLCGEIDCECFPGKFLVNGGGLGRALHLLCRPKTNLDGSQEAPLSPGDSCFGLLSNVGVFVVSTGILWHLAIPSLESSCTIKIPKRKLRKDKNNS